MRRCADNLARFAGLGRDMDQGREADRRSATPRMRVVQPAHQPVGPPARAAAERPDDRHPPPRGVLSRLAGKVIILAALLLSSVFPALADDPVTVTIRSGNHADFGRVVFDAPPRASYHVVRDGDRITVQFADDVALTGDPKLPRNVAALHADHAQAVLTVAGGATFHVARLGDHVVIDVFDPASASGDSSPGPASQRPAPPAVAAGTASTPHAVVPRARPATAATPAAPTPAGSAAAAAPAAPVAPVPTSQPSEAAPSERPTATATVPAPTPATPAARAAAAAPLPTPPPLPDSTAATAPPSVAAAPVSGGTAPVAGATAPPSAATASPSDATPSPEPISLVATLATLPPGITGAAFLVPFSGDVGAAVFNRRGETLVVFDDRRPIDLSALRSNAAFAEARVELLPAGTMIRMTPPPGTAVALSKTSQGWTVAVLAIPPQPLPLTPEPYEALLSVAAREPGSVLAVADPMTGGTLFVGTQRQPGQAMLTLRRTAQFNLLPTAQGVVVVPLADTVALRAVPNGFALTTAPSPLAVSRDGADSLGDVAALTRRFDFPALPTDQLVRQLSAQVADAAALPLLARGPKRRAAAISMIGLGMGAEAEALLQLTAADDPRQAASADIVGLTAVAAMLAGRPAEADGIDDPRLTGTDEIVLWRALHVAMRDNNSPFAAIALVSTAPLLLSYPPPIRDRLLPLAAETMVRNGADAAATALLARAADLPGLDLARAMLAQATGDTDAALTKYDALAAGDDQSVRARAAVRAVELRLATGKFDTRQAAEAFDRLLFAWRGDHRELALREKLAVMRQQLGEWRQALELLRDSETLFPDDVNDIHARLQASFDALLHEDGADKLPPLEFVALVDENADLVPNTREGEAMQAMLADKLVALDLPKRAGPVLDKLMRAVPAGPGRAAFGVRLAKLRLGESDAGGALAALAASDASDLPAALNEQRVLVRADAQARWGDVAGAISTLAGLGSAAADEARIDILEQAKDWLGADRALADYVAKTVPETGELNETARRSVLRLATAAARAGDEATLTSLRERQEARMGTGPLADMFRLLTADPVQGTGDLARAVREVGYARALPANLQAMRP
jgi:hypothetical protein